VQWTEIPELRIIPQDLWEHVQARRQGRRLVVPGKRPTSGGENHGRASHRRAGRCYLHVCLIEHFDVANLKRLQQGHLGLLGTRDHAVSLFHGAGFPEVESELPVDSRLEAISQFFRWTGDLHGLAQQAHAWVTRHLTEMPSSVLDALFFGLPESDARQKELRQAPVQKS